MCGNEQDKQTVMKPWCITYLTFAMKSYHPLPLKHNTEYIHVTYAPLPCLIYSIKKLSQRKEL
jgi:hypothetical protein